MGYGLSPASRADCTYSKFSRDIIWRKQIKIGGVATGSEDRTTIIGFSAQSITAGGAYIDFDVCAPLLIDLWRLKFPVGGDGACTIWMDSEARRAR